MDMTGEYRIPAPRPQVWAALNDPEVLRAAIPGCDELNQVSPTELAAKVTAKVGPVRARFAGNVLLEEINAPESYTLRGEGKGGAAGFVKGQAQVRLEEAGAETILRYVARADIGGKLAQLGSRIVQGAAKKTADDFFGTFSRIVGGTEPEPVTRMPLREAAAAEVDQPDKPPTAEAAPAREVPKRAAAAAEVAARMTAERAAGLGGGQPLWQRPIVWAVGVAVVLLLALVV